MTTPEASPDYAIEHGHIIICGTRMIEHSRDPMGIRWCFTCRKRHEFWWVVTVPEGISYYGPSAHVEGIRRSCSDLFPGWTREPVDA